MRNEFLDAAGELGGEVADRGYGVGAGRRMKRRGPGCVEPGQSEPGDESTLAQRLGAVCATWIAGACAARDADDADWSRSVQAMRLADVYSLPSVSACEILRLESRGRKRFTPRRT
jgi:hypothetical protein